MRFLERTGDVVQVEQGRYYTKAALGRVLDRLKSVMPEDREYTPAEIRESLDTSRKLVLGVNALMMTAVMLVTHVPVGYAIALFSIAFFAQQSWSGIIMTIPADVFPLS